MAALLPFAPAAMADDGGYKLKMRTHRLNFGLKKPIRVVHVSDSHLAFCDARDDARKIEAAKKRHKFFCCENYDNSRSNDVLLSKFEAAAAYAQKTGALLVHTGDMFDFASALNFEIAGRPLSRCDYIASVGNHDFVRNVGDQNFDDNYKKLESPALAKCIKNDISFASKIYGGVNFVALDDNFYCFQPDAIDRLKAEIDKGLPIVLAYHMPIYTPDLFEHRMRRLKLDSAALVGVPHEKLAEYSNKRRREAQRANEATFKFIEFAKSQPLIKAAMCGHLHHSYITKLSGTATQYCVGACFKGEAEEFVIA